MNALCSPLMSGVWLLIPSPNPSSVVLMVELSLWVEQAITPLNNLLDTSVSPKTTLIKTLVIDALCNALINYLQASSLPADQKENPQNRPFLSFLSTRDMHSVVDQCLTLPVSRPPS